MKFGEDGRLYAVNPEAGFFGSAPNTSHQTEPERDGHDRAQHHLHQLRQDRRWRHLVGGDDRRAAGATAIDWHGSDWTPDSETPAAHTERALHHPRRPQCPSIAPEWEGTGRVADRRLPLRRPPGDGDPARLGSLRLEHAVFMGATMSSETTAAAAGEVGKLASTRWRCCPSAATTWPTTSTPTG